MTSEQLFHSASLRAMRGTSITVLEAVCYMIGIGIAIVFYMNLINAKDANSAGLQIDYMNILIVALAVSFTTYALSFPFVAKRSVRVRLITALLSSFLGTLGMIGATVTFF